MYHPVINARAGRPFACLLLLVVCLGAMSPSRPAAQTPPAASGDLDAFMEKVLARRDVNRATLNQYVLDETETFEVLGPGRMRLHRTKRDFTWYVRDGMHVRSPVRFDGVGVGPEARDDYEQNWIRRERARQERRAKKEPEKGDVSIGPDGIQLSSPTAAVPTEPRFVSEAYFMDFKFEPGNYYLAGREQLDGHDVLRIEYYPTRLFSDDDKKTPKELKDQSRERRRERDIENEIDRKMNKTALVTLWVDPTEHQIVKYTFDNVWLDFLPGAWLVRIDDLRASMTMGQPFPGVWLPRDIGIHAGMTLAAGSFEASYDRAFAQYREADVTTKIRIPKAPQDTLDAVPDGGHGPYDSPNTSGGTIDTAPATAPRARQALQESGRQEIVREVRVHGNAFLADADVLTIAAITIGEPLAADGPEAIRARLESSGHFDTVEVRKRYRSLTDLSDVALVLIVNERPGVTSVTQSDSPVLRPLRRLREGLMFLPIVSFADGYGFTYGGRVSAIDTLGIGERLSVPLTWGGTRRAALEFERTFNRGPVTRVMASGGIWQRENPRFEIDDRRVELKAGLERQFAQVVRLGAEATRASVTFGDLDDRLWTIGATAAIDTRGNPAYPSNAIFLGGGWNALHVRGLDRINRYTADGRGYLRVVGQAVLAGRAFYASSDGRLPPYERLLLGGSSTLRGFQTGAFDGDRLVASSAELRVPLTSVISGARLGVSAFIDAAKTVNVGERFDGVNWRRGAGAGVFLMAPLFKLNLDIARGLDGGGTRVHFGTGFSF